MNAFSKQIWINLIIIAIFVISYHTRLCGLNDDPDLVSTLKREWCLLNSLEMDTAFAE